MGPSFFWTWNKQSTKDVFEVESASSAVMQARFQGKTGKIIDFSSLSYQASFGHTPDFITNALKAQMDKFCVASPKAYFDLKEVVARGLIDLLNIGEGKIYFCNSGSEAIENALKLLRVEKKGNIILSRQFSYHGSTLGSLSITGDWRREDHRTVDEWNAFIPEPAQDPDLTKTRALIEKIGPQNIAGFCLETITGTNGVIIAPASWWAGISKLCQEFDLGLIVDEVICGFGRTGRPFGIHHYPELRPDFVCMAKAITGGVFPLGAVYIKETIASKYQDQIFSAGTTNTGHPLAMAAAKSVLTKLESRDFWQNLSERAALVDATLAKIRHLKGVKETRRIGLLAAIDHEEAPSWETFMQAGLYLIAQKKRLILAPALTMTLDEYTEGLHRLEKVLRAKDALL